MPVGARSVPLQSEARRPGHRHGRGCGQQGAHAINHVPCIHNTVPCAHPPPLAALHDRRHLDFDKCAVSWTYVSMHTPHLLFFAVFARILMLPLSELPLYYTLLRPISRLSKGFCYLAKAFSRLRAYFGDFAANFSVFALVFATDTLQFRPQ